MDELVVELVGGKSVRFEAPPQTQSQPFNAWMVDERGTLLVGVSLLAPRGVGDVRLPAHRMEVSDGFAPGSWVRVSGGRPVREGGPRAAQED